jgi:peptidoglycan/xylan/chitin deacetylase (PgdA/CDA1 family)
VERRLWPRAAVILLYHRVADPTGDIWGLTVSPDRFAEQIEALKTTRRVLPLGELAAAAASRRAYDRPLAAVTFDDGYHDAFTAARPILHRLDCPATVFVVSGMVDAAREFWWDELAHIFLDTADLPPTLRLTFGAETREWRFSPDHPGARVGACHGLRRHFRDLSPDRIEACLERLRDWAGVAPAARPDHRVMKADEVARLSDGLITVGAHTVSHPSMPLLSAEAQRIEVAESRKACEALTGGPVEHFAYPFGDYNADSVAAARAAGFATACATIPGPVLRSSDPFRLPRINPGLADGEALIRALS